MIGVREDERIMSDRRDFLGKKRRSLQHGRNLVKVCSPRRLSEGVQGYGGTCQDDSDICRC